LLTEQLSPKLVAIDAEHNMSFLRIQWSEDDTNLLQLVTDRAIVGHSGEILDLAVITQLATLDNKDKHMVAVATNSSQVRIFGLGGGDEDGEENQQQHHWIPMTSVLLSPPTKSRLA
jgi:hypothetical protein